MELKKLDIDDSISRALSHLGSTKREPGDSGYDPEKKKAKHFGFHEVMEVKGDAREALQETHSNSKPEAEGVNGSGPSEEEVREED